MPVWNKFTDEEKAVVRQLYETTELTLQQIADKIGRASITIHHYIHAMYSKTFIRTRKKKCYRNSKLGDKNPQTGKFGELHANYKGVVMDGNGYLIIIKPAWYTARKHSKHIFLHHKVLCEYFGLTAIPAGYQVHHCDENKTNNDIGNLVMLTCSAHTKLHWYLKSLEGATTISKESTLKWVEAHCPGGLWHPGDDIV